MSRYEFVVLIKIELRSSWMCTNILLKLLKMQDCSEKMGQCQPVLIIQISS